MSTFRGGLHFDEYDEVEVELMHVDGLDGPRDVVNVIIGGIALHFRAKDIDLLRSLETCTAIARQDLEEIIRRAAHKSQGSNASDPQAADGSVAA